MKRLMLAASLGLIMAGSASAHPMGMGGPGPGPKADANRDGKMSLAEFQASHLERMMKLDTNQDSKISEAEFLAMKPMMGSDGPPPPAPRPGMDKKSKDHMDHKMGKGPGHNAHQTMMFDMMDRNDDGAITSDEISAMSAKPFKRMDKNADGVLTPDERPHWGKRGPKHDHDGPEPK